MNDLAERFAAKSAEIEAALPGVCRWEIKPPTIKARPILFSAPMIRALLAGRKAQTRRTQGLKGINGFENGTANGHRFDCAGVFGDRFFARFWADRGDNSVATAWCPYGKPGDRLWVRESGVIFKEAGLFRHDVPATKEIGVYWVEKTRAPGASYNATGCTRKASLAGRGAKACPSIHMPRWASRILLEIADIRVERLQDISEEDAKAEGMFFTDYGRSCGHFAGQGWVDYDPKRCPAPLAYHAQRSGWMWDKTSSHEECLAAAKWAFANLWCHVNGENAWVENPWVWVVTFRRIEP